MARFGWIFFSFVIYLHINSIHSQSDEIIECEWYDSTNLQFFCRESESDSENYNKGSFISGTKKIYCKNDPAGEPKSKSEFHSIEFIGCQFSQLKYNIFTSYGEIQTINLSNVGLVALRPQDLNNADHLEELDVSSNNLTEISAMIFENAPNITGVNFSYNRISRIDPKAFDHSSPNSSCNITTLDLSNNRIASIDNHTFAALTELITLKLDSNQLEVIEADIFSKNIHLEWVYLSLNHIKTFSCQHMNKLGYLDLSSNNLSFFDGSCVTSEKRLISLYINDNQLTNITLHHEYYKLDVSSNELKWISIESNLSELSSLSVSNNKIENIPEVIEHIGDNMIDLNLSGNFMGELSIDIFTKLKNLTKLYLRNTSLENIPYGAFHYQKKLVYLDISFNNLKKINFNAFWLDLPMLQELYVDANNLTELNGLSKVDFPKVKSLGITKNNFTCKYLSEYLRQWNGTILLSDDESLSNKSHVQGVFCNFIA